ncbi:MAG: 3-phosphoserine/phosphohydroxythreonine transaminase [Pseudomonadota bacterium]
MPVYNFSAGPAALPGAVLARIGEELGDWQGRGVSVMEVSHRSREFVQLADRSEKRLRRLLKVPDKYAVLFMQGGATGQFAAVPLNISQPGEIADFIVSGYWGEKAVAQSRCYLDPNVIADGREHDYRRLPECTPESVDGDAAYVHYTPNETIGGVEYRDVPEVGGVPLVADYSSSLLSEPVDVSRFGVIYAGAQKNIGPAGLTVVIVSDELLGRARAETPSVMNYTMLASAKSMANTPPTFAWYAADLVFEWLEAEGGLDVIGAQNARKAALLYNTIDRSDLYHNPVWPAHRSRMNVPFLLTSPKLENEFLVGAESAGLRYLKGHRSVGGMRASLYNAVPLAAVEALVEYMREFERRA